MSTQEEAIPGGWSAYTSKIDAEAKAAFEEAMHHLLGVSYAPVAVSQQLVAGMNYKFFSVMQRLLCSTRFIMRLSLACTNL